MPVFNYEAADKSGRKLKASIEAANEAEVKDRLFGMGLLPLSISTATERKGLIGSAGRITSQDLLALTQELANLLEAGLPVDRAVYVLSAHSAKPALKNVLSNVYRDIQRGQALSQALAAHPVFPKLYVNMVRAGEVGGALEPVLRRLAAFLETSVSFEEELRTALVYPMILTTVGSLAVLFILFFVVPRFATMFEGMGQSLPMATLMLMNLSGFIRNFWWAVILGITAAVILLRSYAATSEGKQLMDTLKLKLPVISALHSRAMIARFTRTLGTLLQSGVPILEAITVARDVVGNSIIASRLSVLEEGVRSGRGISTPLRESDVFPPIVVEMIAVGEEAGRLDQTFMSVAERFEAESRSLVKRAIGLVGPILILLMSAVVGFIVVSMLLAVFSINEIPL